MSKAQRKENITPAPSRPQITEVVPEVSRKSALRIFCQRLNQQMTLKGWTTQELCRRTKALDPENRGIDRDSAGNYIRGTAIPSRRNLELLAKAFGVEAMDLLPAFVGRGDIEAVPAISLKVLPNKPGFAFLQINKECSLEIASKIVALLAADDE